MKFCFRTSASAFHRCCPYWSSVSTPRNIQPSFWNTPICTCTPSAQAGLADFLIEVMKQRNLQLIVESHSEHLLRRLQRRAAEAKLHPDEVALYFCDIQDGVSGLTKLEFDVFGQISNWPDGFFGDMTADMIASLESSLDRPACRWLSAGSSIPTSHWSQQKNMTGQQQNADAHVRFSSNLSSTAKSVRLSTIIGLHIPNTATICTRIRIPLPDWQATF